MRTLQEWLDLYEKKTNERTGFGDGFRLFYFPDKGFSRMKVDEKTHTLMIKETCGNGKFWYNFAIEYANNHKLDKIALFVCRNFESYVRFFGGKIVSSENKVFYGKNKDGHRFESYPYNKTTRFVIQYLV